MKYNRKKELKNLVIICQKIIDQMSGSSDATTPDVSDMHSMLVFITQTLNNIIDIFNKRQEQQPPDPFAKVSLLIQAFNLIIDGTKDFKKFSVAFYSKDCFCYSRQECKEDKDLKNFVLSFHWLKKLFEKDKKYYIRPEVPSSAALQNTNQQFSEDTYFVIIQNFFLYNIEYIFKRLQIEQANPYLTDPTFLEAQRRDKERRQFCKRRHLHQLYGSDGADSSSVDSLDDPKGAAAPSKAILNKKKSKPSSVTQGHGLFDKKDPSGSEAEDETEAVEPQPAADASHVS